MPKRPTQEELAASLKAITEKEEQFQSGQQGIYDDPADPKDPPADPAPADPPADDPSDPPADPPTDPADPKDPPADPAPADPPTDPDHDWKKRYSDSTREAHRIAAKNRKVDEAIDAEIPDPTEEDLKGEYADWEDMTPTEQRLAKDNLISKRFRENLRSAREAGKQIEKWEEEVTKFADDPKLLVDNPDLEGKLDEFKEFANDDKNRSIPLETLVDSFLYKKSKEKKPAPKGQMFERGTGGAITKGKQITDKLTVEEGARLMQSNPKKWKEMAKAGKIDFDSIE